MDSSLMTKIWVAQSSKCSDPPINRDAQRRKMSNQFILLTDATALALAFLVVFTADIGLDL